MPVLKFGEMVFDDRVEGNA